MDKTIYYRKGDTEYSGGTRSQGHFIVSFESILKGKTGNQLTNFISALKSAAISENNTLVEVYKDGKLIGKAWDFNLAVLTPNAIEFWGDFNEEVDSFKNVELRIK